jgi:hypothetical protein
MKRIGFILALLAAAISIGAQVIIGPTGNELFHEAAMLELRANGERGGLLMPQVELQSASRWEPLLGSASNGMTVYNTFNTTQNGLSGKGVYVWTDGHWYPIVSSSEPCLAPPKTPVLAVNGLEANNMIDEFKPFMASVSNPEPATLYIWELPAGLMGHSSTNVITIVGHKPGAYTIKVRATNECGASSESSHTLTINPSFRLPSAKDGSGKVTLQGITCYDVAQTAGPGCGSLGSRRPAFATAAQRTRTYTLSIAINSNQSNLRVGVADDVNGIIQSVSGDVPGQLSRNEYPITVVFADNINDIIKNKGKSTAKLSAVFREGTGDAADKYVALTITVQDCSCCPLNVAYVVTDAAYKGPDVFDIALGPTALARTFSQIPGASLCVFNSDQGSPLNNLSNSNNWANATLYCTQAMTKTYGEGWRLPNLAELYYKLHRSTKFSWTTNNQGRYLASTLKKGSTSSSRKFFYTQITQKNPSDIILQEVGGTAVNVRANFRCVKTINY